jgi:hypothetical protein
MGTVRGLIFSYNMIMKQKRGTSSDKATSVIVE